MLSNDAEARLKEFNDTAFPKKMITITDRVRIAVGWGHSNCIIVEGDTSLILVDTLDSDARAARLKDELSRLTDKPVKTIFSPTVIRITGAAVARSGTRWRRSSPSRPKRPY